MFTFFDYLLSCHNECPHRNVTYFLSSIDKLNELFCLAKIYDAATC